MRSIWMEEAAAKYASRTVASIGLGLSIPQAIAANGTWARALFLAIAVANAFSLGWCWRAFLHPARSTSLHQGGKLARQ